jgi:hypothetical protein
VGDNLIFWHDLVGKVMGVQLNDRKDEFVWFLNKKFFSVNSMSKDLVRENSLRDVFPRG